MFKTILNPDLYHGKRKKRNFFEGWYFKLSDASGESVLALIPGISKGHDEELSHSFIQVLDGRDRTYQYITGKESEFAFSEERFDIDVFGNHFSDTGISISLDNGRKSVKGRLEFKNLMRWPGTRWSPGSMGYYNYITFMECYSQVTAMDGKVRGVLEVDGEILNLDGGSVYIEKNWGREFPKSWIWIQSNSFGNDEVSFTCSIGRVPFGPFSFHGFLAGIYVGEVFYGFTKMNGAKVDIERRGQDVSLLFERKGLELLVTTESEPNDFILCKGPRDGKMVPLVEESLNGRVNLKLYDKKSGETIYSGTGVATGIEYGGDDMTFN